MEFLQFLRFLVWIIHKDLQNLPDNKIMIEDQINFIMKNQNENFNIQQSCPITQQQMTDRVIADDVFSYQRKSIEHWSNTSSISPITGILLSTTKLIPNRTLKQTMDKLLQIMKTENHQDNEQKKLERDIARMQEELKKKKIDLFQLREQIDTIEQKLAETKRHLQKITKEQEEKTKAEQELLASKTKLFEEIGQQQWKFDIVQHRKYRKFIKQSPKGQKQLNMFDRNVTDQMVQEIAQFDLSRIQQLNLRDNKITDNGFDLLFQNREWPVLQQIHLDKNKIQNIHSLHKIPNLQILRIYRNELSEGSCTYLCEHQWPKIIYLLISFKKGLNDVCWQKLLTVIKEKFPKLNYLDYWQKGDVNLKNQKKIKNYCENNSIVLQSYK